VRHLLLALDSLAATEASGEELDRKRCELLLALGSAHAQTGEGSEAQAAFLAAAEIARALSLPEALARAAIGLVGRTEDPRGGSEDAKRWN
jgi:hypothetical protein